MQDYIGTFAVSIMGAEDMAAKYVAERVLVEKNLKQTLCLRVMH